MTRVEEIVTEVLNDTFEPRGRRGLFFWPEKPEKPSRPDVVSQATALCRSVVYGVMAA
jgi:hypothetical protein